MKGYIHVFTGNGKGKTTAALGMAMRAAGAGMNVFIGQFVKGMPYAEHQVLDKLAPRITYRRYGLDCFIVNRPTPADVQAARKGLEEVSGIIMAGRHQLVILDEATIALHYKLFTFTELMNPIRARPPHVEIVITGRYAPAGLIRAADLVTDMQEVKHYYQKGVEARKGFEF
ncbi:MAG: cob(I)yrinic acid a,c-diamide adenosyltransferase [delta proteobacterium ML8_D]|jgi:cob(I)alamin adenosyltransferase|nr:MAG: cob(I)yrinic acid a,c-diamide adenosyltransferase [delta proteobacterium ML8_D]